MPRFEFDPGKNRTNRESMALTSGGSNVWSKSHVIIPAKMCSRKKRFAIIAEVRIVLYCCLCGKIDAIRIISCHKADAKWKKIYETFSKKDQVNKITAASLTGSSTGAKTCRITLT